MLLEFCTRMAANIDRYERETCSTDNQTSSLSERVSGDESYCTSTARPPLTAAQLIPMGIEITSCGACDPRGANQQPAPPATTATRRDTTVFVSTGGPDKMVLPGSLNGYQAIQSFLDKNSEEFVGLQGVVLYISNTDGTKRYVKKDCPEKGMYS
jgi:hypothetical protein